MLEKKEHYKMYKDGKSWTFARITTATACVSLLSTLVMGGTISSKVNADAVSSMQSTSVLQKRLII